MESRDKKTLVGPRRGPGNSDGLNKIPLCPCLIRYSSVDLLRCRAIRVIIFAFETYFVEFFHSSWFFDMLNHISDLVLEFSIGVKNRKGKTTAPVRAGLRRSVQVCAVSILKTLVMQTFWYFLLKKS